MCEKSSAKKKPLKLLKKQKMFSATSIKIAYKLAKVCLQALADEGSSLYGADAERSLSQSITGRLVRGSLVSANAETDRIGGSDYY
jgi:hypothetical protein